jgi:hypothetical protein
MSNEPPGANEPEADELRSESGSTSTEPTEPNAKSRFARLRESRWLQLRSKRFLICAAGLLFVLGVAGWWVFQGSEPTVAPQSDEPSPAERFAKLFDELQKSDETIARMDAFTIDDSMLNSLTTLDRLTTIQVEIESLLPATVEKLSKMPKLEQLHLRKASITDEMLRQLSASSTIWLLNLPDAKVSPEAIETLQNMPLLRQLRLGIEDGDNRHARAVAKLTRLRAVHLIAIGVTDEGLQALAGMPQLESLYLDDSAVTEAGWSWLFQNHPELHVHINQKHHDRDPQKH